MAVRSVVGVLLLAEGCLGDLYLHVSPGLPLTALQLSVCGCVGGLVGVGVLLPLGLLGGSSVSLWLCPSVSSGDAVH